MFDFTEIFCTVDDFFKKFEPIYWQFLKQENKRKRIRFATLSISEIVTIAICYKTSQVHNFKIFFQLLCQFERSKGQACQYLWIDSTPLPVCKNKRIPKGHHALDDIASRGKSSIDWFSGRHIFIFMCLSTLSEE